MLNFKDFVETKTKEKVLEEADLTYAGISDVSTIEVKITIPVKAKIRVNTYTDRKTGKVSAAKTFEIDYANKAMQEAIDDQIVAAVKKVLPNEDLTKPEHGWGSHRQIGFVNSIPNKQYQKDSEY